MDQIASNIMLPALRNGQWLEFSKMGAYTNMLYSNFNGFRNPQIMVLVSSQYAKLLSVKHE